MLGELLFEIKGRVTSSRILNADEYKIECFMTQEGKLDIKIIIKGTVRTKPAGKNVIYGEGQGIITTKHGEDTATFKGYDIGRTNEQIRSSFRRSIFLSHQHQQMENFHF